MLFTNSLSTAVSSNLPPLELVQSVGSFFLLLNSGWVYPSIVEWTVEESSSADNITFSDWSTAAIVIDSKSHANITDVNPRWWYRFRYKIRSKSEISDWSVPQIAGRPKVLVLDTGNNTTYAYTVGEYDTNHTNELI